MTSHDDLAQALRQLATTLEQAGLWDEPCPEPAAFESRQPFCVDTMTLPQWLRYVFIARLQALVDAQAQLPVNCAVAPAMEVWLKDSTMTEKGSVIRDIAVVDRIVTEA